MADRFDNGSIVAVQTVPHSQTDKYGIVKSGSRRADLLRVDQIVEKPKPRTRRRPTSPSWVATCSRRASSTHLERIGEGAGGEIQLTDGIARLMNDEAVYAYRFEGKRFDCGSKLGYLQANVEYALKHPELASSFKTYLRKLAARAFDRGRISRRRSRRLPPVFFTW